MFEIQKITLKVDFYKTTKSGSGLVDNVLQNFILWFNYTEAST